MKNTIQIDIDSDREDTVIIGKPKDFRRPESKEEFAYEIINDMATLCEAICTLIHVADQNGLKPSDKSVQDCINHIKNGFGDPSYIGKLINPKSEQRMKDFKP